VLKLAIEKMKFVNISGLLSDFDRVLNDIAYNSEFYLEDAKSIFSSICELKAFDENNIYEDLYTKIKDIYLALGLKAKYNPNCIKEIDNEKFTLNLISIADKIRNKNAYLDELLFSLDDSIEILNELTYFININVNMLNFFHLNNIKFRFGVMPTYNYKKIEIYLGDINAVIFPLKVDENETFFMYFVSLFWENQVDETFKKMMFRRIRISKRVSGTPKVAKEKIEQEIKELEIKIEALRKEIDDDKEKLKNELEVLYSTIKYNYEVYSIRKSVAKGERSFHITGFIPAKLAGFLEEQLKNDENTVMLTKEPCDIGDLTPPTKLTNIKIFKPFEMLVNLFSLPTYNEIDPTPFLAIVYSLLFGIMFADLGQGLVLAVLGFLIYKFKKLDIAGVLAFVGIFSAFFGIMFGSVFGNEEILPPILIHPMKDALAMSEILLSTVAIGFVLIIFAMIFNLINAFKTKRVEEIFSNKGMAGLVFYFSGGLIAVISAINGAYTMSLWVTVSFLILPLILIFLKEPLTLILEKKRCKVEGEYFAESFFELFESLLSYTTNTMSFVRVGAFALNHVGMMTVVYVLAKNAGGFVELPVIFFGNILVMGLEGLIVGIQVLRLMFYELFSKFYTGGGKPYIPFKVE
jgi:V/A-type H+-transporting ATPase subunit I